MYACPLHLDCALLESRDQVWSHFLCGVYGGDSVLLGRKLRIFFYESLEQAGGPSLPPVAADGAVKQKGKERASEGQLGSEALTDWLRLWAVWQQLCPAGTGNLPPP